MVKLPIFLVNTWHQVPYLTAIGCEVSYWYLWNLSESGQFYCDISESGNNSKSKSLKREFHISIQRVRGGGNDRKGGMVVRRPNAEDFWHPVWTKHKVFEIMSEKCGRNLSMKIWCLRWKIWDSLKENLRSLMTFLGSPKKRFGAGIQWNFGVSKETSMGPPINSGVSNQNLGVFDETLGV